MDPFAVTIAIATRIPRAESFARVKRFWTVAPARSPVTLSQVRTATTTSATSCAVENVVPRRVTSACSSPTPGTKKPSVLAKATATAATKPVLMARSRVQPYRKPKRGENASERKTYCPPARGMAAASSA